MPEGWELLTVDTTERQRFATLESTLALPFEPAGPPNRLREVRWFESEGLRYYLKVFHRTQAKNRLRFLLSRPRARNDAEREAEVTGELRARGIEAPRPVALGRRGPSSFYLCAELPGTALVELLRQGAVSPQLLDHAARFCGQLLAGGAILPDLSAEHLFVEPGDGGYRFGVLDLHNGSLGSRVSRKTATRVLKHFQRSVRGLVVPRSQALRFAARLLKSAGLKARVRSILSRVPPLDTHGRYESPSRAEAYRGRSMARSSRELDSLRRVWPGRNRDLVLDAPCGVGRLSAVLVGELGARLVAADRSSAMVSGATGPVRPELVVRADSLALPFADRSFDGAVVFRFLHHLPPDLARPALAEACRVSSRYLVVSFFHPVSLHGLRRRLVEAVTGKARTRHALRLGTVRSWLEQGGFFLHRVTAERRFVRDFWLASFVRP